MTFPGPGGPCSRNEVSYLEIIPSRSRVVHDPLNLGSKVAWGVLRVILCLSEWGMWGQNETVGSAVFKKSIFPEVSASRNHSIIKPLELINTDVCLFV